MLNFSFSFLLNDMIYFLCNIDSKIKSDSASQKDKESLVLKARESHLMGPVFLCTAKQPLYLLLVISKQSKIWTFDIDSLAEYRRRRVNAMGMESIEWIYLDGRMFYSLFKNNTKEGI